MTSYEFVIWLKGFTEACNDYTATPKQWDRIKEVLEDVEDYDDNTGIDVEIDDYKPERDIFRNPSYPPPIGPYTAPYWSLGTPAWIQNPGTTSGTTIISGSGNITTSGSGSGNTFTTTDGTTTNTVTVWNDKMGCWHYTNYPEGFGYYTNSTLDKTIPEETKKQLLD
jgi:hypothetical protein